MKKVLFTGGGGAGSEAILRIIGNQYDVYFADCDVSNIDPIIPSERKIKIPSASDVDYFDVLASSCKNLGIDFLVPGVDEELLSISSQRNKLDCVVVLPQHSFVEIMLDKKACSKALGIRDLARPNIYSFDSHDELRYPVIIKPRRGRGSRGVWTIRNRKELEAYMTLFNFKSEEVLIQDLIVGDEYTVFVSANHKGELNCILPVLIKKKRGITISAITDMNAPIVSYIEKFHKCFEGPHGIYNFQCILTVNNEVYPFEVNPRVSTTFCIALASGFDPFAEYLKDVTGMFMPKQKYELGRHWKNIITTSC